LAAGFIASTDTILAGDTIYFTDTSTYNPTSWLWNFGDGNTSTSQNPTHTYITAGIYTVSLTVTNLYGNDILTKTSYIYVQQYTPSVLAAFSMDKNTAHIGDSVQFTDLSTGSPASWLWHFGDGDSSSLQNPVHKYNTAGTFEIKLLISDSLSSDTAVKTLIILSLEDGLVAYYPFSGNSADSSGNGHHGTEYGGVSLTTDKMGNPNSAYNFDGVNDYIKVNDHDSLDLTDNMTISAWIKIDNFSFLAGIVSKYHTYQSNGFTFRLGYSSPYKGLNCNGRRTSETLLQANTWYHIVSVVENNVVNIYVDGQVVSTAYSVVPAQSNSNFMSIGMDYSSSARYFDGIIDEVRLYNRPLSLSEIQTLYSTDYTQSQTISGFTMSQDTLLVGDTLQLTDTSANNPTSWNWNFGDGNTSNIQNPEHVYATPGDYTITLIASNSSGSDTSITQVKVYSLNQALLAYYPFSGNANDSSGNSEHLTVNGASLTSDRFGNPNSAYYFDGIDDYLKNASPNFAMGEDSSFTVSLWVNSTGTGRFFWHGLLLNQGGSGKFVYFMAAASTQNSQLGVAKQGLAWTWTYYPNSYNTWEHWVFVYDNGQIKLYKNGTEVASNTYTKAGATTSTMPFYLGCESGVSGYLNGKIDEVRIYRRALSTFEIQKLY
jgi:PKD repeat protein